MKCLVFELYLNKAVKVASSTSHYYSVFLFLVFLIALNHCITYSVLLIYLPNVHFPLLVYKFQEGVYFVLIASTVPKTVPDFK